MKIALLAATALVSSTFITTPAYAGPITPPAANAPDSATETAMQDQCDALAAAHDTANGDIWTAAVVLGAVTQVGSTTEVTDSRVIDTSSIQGTGTYVPGELEIRGSPFKTGGSVNLFGDQWSGAGYYPDSTYDYTADYDSTFSHAFSCDISQAVYHAEETIHHGAEGQYVNWDFGHGQGNDNGTGSQTEEFPQGSCAAHNATGPSWDQWGEDTEQCKFIGTQAYDETIPEFHDAAAFVVNEPGIAVNQSQTDSDVASFEEHGGIVYVTTEYHVGQVVICNSPGSKGGAWRVQNGYNGGSMTGPAAGCNTPYFKIAPWGNGSQTSNGTFTSVPNYNY